MTGESILVTGAGGFTGGHFVREAAARGYRCVAVCNADGPSIEGAHASHRLDLRERASTFELLRAIRPRYVVHLAAVSFVAHEDLSEMYQSNVVGAINLVDAAAAPEAAVERVLVASSANVYGNAARLPILESAAVAPQNDYAVSKVAMEYALSVRKAREKLIIVRPFNYTGVGQAAHFLVPKIVAAHVRQCETLELGNIDVERDFSDVRDVVRAYLGLLVSKRPTHPLNVCSGRPVSVRFLLDTMRRLSGHDPRLLTNPSLVRRQDIRTLYGSDEQLRMLIGEYRSHSIEDTLVWMYQSGLASQ